MLHEHISMALEQLINNASKLDMQDVRAARASLYVLNAQGDAFVPILECTAGPEPDLRKPSVLVEPGTKHQIMQ